MAIAEWKYPFPSRTRKSSALTPMVLQRCGRVGSRQALFFLPFVGLRALRFLRPCEAVHAALSPHSLLALHPASLEGTSSHHARMASSPYSASCTEHCRRFGSSPCIAACFGWNSILHASSSSLGASSPHHSQCIRGRSVASVASVVVVASVVSVTFVPSVASVVHACCPLFPKKQKCGHPAGGWSCLLMLCR